MTPLTAESIGSWSSSVLDARGPGIETIHVDGHGTNATSLDRSPDSYALVVGLAPSTS